MFQAVSTDPILPKTLAQYSTKALLAEIQKRGNCGRRSPIIPCDECAWFKASKGTPPDDDYNPCSLGHTMLFRTPVGHPHDEVWGFYLPRCRDRKRLDRLSHPH